MFIEIETINNVVSNIVFYSQRISRDNVVWPDRKWNQGFLDYWLSQKLFLVKAKNC